MHDSTYIKILENANSSLMSKSRSVVAWGGGPRAGRSERDRLQRGPRKFLGEQICSLS